MDNILQIKTNMEISGVTFFFPERVSSVNTEQISAELDYELSQFHYQLIILDLDKTEYISSAGLRVILKLQKHYKELEIINVSREVEEIFDITGFKSFLHIKKKIREFNTDGLEIIGNGATAIVYRIDEDTILKVFHKGISIEAIKREIEIAKKSFFSGVQTAIPYDVVKVGEQYGTIYEKISGESLAIYMHKYPDHIQKCSNNFGKFMKEMHKIELNTRDFPSAKERYHEYITLLSAVLTQEQSLLIKKMFDHIPEGQHFTHGDFHPNNVMLEQQELLLIDMGEVSYGSPIFDFMGFGVVRLLSNVFPDDEAQKLSGMNCTEIKQSWDAFLHSYFDKMDSKDFEIIHSLCMLYSAVRGLILTLKIPTVPDSVKAYLTGIIETLYSDELVNKLNGLF